MLNFASVINLFFLNKKSPEPLPVRCLFMHKLFSLYHEDYTFLSGLWHVVAKFHA